MDMKSPLTCPNTVTVRRNPHRRARPTTASAKCPQNSVVLPVSSASEVPSFPIEEILAMEVPKSPKPSPESSSENLRVFLRIRPIFPSKDQNLKSRAKNAWPQNPAKKSSVRDRTAAKKNSGDVCITVNDSHSVTLSPPLSLKESKRIKAEVYEGFSHVFDTDSSQEQVFERLVSPLVEEFLKGKSGMLAALGPSGSGKTHTVFGSPRDPGVVPRTLQRIFKPNMESASNSQRSVGLSIFEIHSERGKGEKLRDLSPGGVELTMQNSTIRGLQEVTVFDAKEAESFVALAMVRRLTATTNSNSQSSRSQCIINIRSVPNNSNGEEDCQANNAVLSIIDLAGAEREKKTGNQGARLIESNFINNTSMVFGLCLRSLLEHQKNPKRPLQKHFQNSLLTRYLRDYLEGKRRMALILTVKSAEEDYLDTMYLLRQASPFMSIKFDNLEEKLNAHKRQYQTISRQEKLKRTKLSESDASEIGERKASEDQQKSPRQGVAEGAPEILNRELLNGVPLKGNDDKFISNDKSYQILQSLAKAIWSVLKQRGKQLKASEVKIQRLTENLELEKTRNTELVKELELLKLNCKCAHQKSVEVGLAEADIKFEPGVELSGLGSTNFEKPNLDAYSLTFSTPECDETPKMNDLFPKHNQALSQSSSELLSSSPETLMLNFLEQEHEHEQEQVENEALSSNSKALDSIEKEQVFDSLGTGLDIEAFYSSAKTSEKKHQKGESFPSDSKVLECVENEQSLVTPVITSDGDEVDCPSVLVEMSQQKYMIDQSFSGSGHKADDIHNSIRYESNHACVMADMADRTMNSSPPLVMPGDDSCSSAEVDQVVIDENQELLNLPKAVSTSALSSEDCTVIDTVEHVTSIVEKPRKPLEPVNDDPKVVDKPNLEQRIDSSVKLGKSKRRLLPASSSLLRDFNTLEIGDKLEKPKGNRGSKILSSEERNITQGNISLMRLLKNNYR